MTFSPVKLRAAAICGFLAVALGAFGAHGLKSHWEATLEVSEAAYRLDIWKTAVFYHLAHSVVILVLAFACPAVHEGKLATWSFLLGINIFSGSLYSLAVTGIKWMGAITPLGGVFLLLGWLLLAFQPGGRR
jgi:uncharacterized membrane protein YgdD (TMEM256/DUF423 family)